MATSKTGGSGDKPVAKKSGGATPAKTADTAKKAGGTAAKKTGGATAKKPAGAANVQPKGQAAAKKSGGAAGGAASGKANARRQVYRDFAGSRLGGWSHDDWEGLIGDLQKGGHDVTDREAVGMELERERLTMVLEKVPGVSSQKAKSIVSRYGRLYDLRQASPDDIAEAGKVPRPLAERIAEAIR